MTTTLADVAREVGVSTAAASLAMNGKPGVSAATRDRVLEAAHRLGYRPNPAGRALRSSRAGAIGLYLPNSAVHFGYYTEATNGVAEALHRSGIPLLVLPNAAHGARLDTFPAVDGYLMIEPHSDDPGVAEILAQDLPVVTGDRPPRGFGDPWGIVESPNGELVRTVFDRFLAGGAKRPGMIQIERVSEWTLELEASYLAWCAEHGLEPRIAEVGFHDSNEEILRSLAGFFDETSGCDAVLTAATASRCASPGSCGPSASASAPMSDSSRASTARSWSSTPRPSPPSTCSPASSAAPAPSCCSRCSTRSGPSNRSGAPCPRPSWSGPRADRIDAERRQVASSGGKPTESGPIPCVCRRSTQSIRPRPRTPPRRAGTAAARVLA